MPAVRGGADKWKRRSAAAQSDYQAGVMRPRRQWNEATRAAAETYAQGVQQAIADGRYAKAATPENAAKHQMKSATIGAQRYAPGIAASGDAYARGFEPYRQVIEATQLPQRGPKGDPQNYQRSAAMGQALNAAKVAKKSQS